FGYTGWNIRCNIVHRRPGVRIDGDERITRQGSAPFDNSSEIIYRYRSFPVAACKACVFNVGSPWSGVLLAVRLSVIPARDTAPDGDPGIRENRTEGVAGGAEASEVQSQRGLSAPLDCNAWFPALWIG